MQTPKRKPGTYSHLKTDPHITEEKQRSLKMLLKKLKEEQKVSSKEVARLAEFGDFSENHAYQMEKGRLRGINQRIKDTEDLLGRAIIITAKKRSKVVELGSAVTIEMQGKRHAYRILGPSETDPSSGVISYTSPLGAALMGHGAGEEVVVDRQGESASCTIISIS